MLRPKIFMHPILFTTASVLYMYLIAAVIASPNQMIRVWVFFVGILITLAFPAYWLTKDWGWAGVLLSVIAVSFFSPLFFFQAELATIAAATLICFIYLSIRKTSLKLKHITNILNLTSLFFALAVVYFVARRSAGITVSDFFSTASVEKMPAVELPPNHHQPDIYYIVVDGYGRADILNEYYGYDNSEFIENLHKKGFIVPSQSKSNYAKTVLSVSSTLNMNYVSELKPELQNVRINYWWLLAPLIDYNSVRLMLEENGYRSYSITTGWDLTDNHASDVYYQPKPIIFSDLEFVVFTITPMKIFTPLLSDIAYIPSFDEHRNLFLYNFSALSEISKDASPKFVFAHLVSPHPPFVFGEEGQPLTPKYQYSFNDASDITISDAKYKNGYIRQLKFLNKQLEKIVDEILENSITPPIIIIQADHGPGMMTDFSSIENTCLRERFSTFAAYYLPDQETSVIPDTITPVNLFRIIFNEYFGTDFQLLSNNHYYSQEIIFQNVDVTSIVDTCSVSR